MRLLALSLLALACGGARPAPNPTPAPTPQATRPAEKTKTQNASGFSAKETEKLARYPKEWEVAVPAGTKLDDLRKSLEKEVDRLPEGDLEDRSPLPPWFRVYLRKQHPDLKSSGPYQYPRNANRLLQYLVQHPDSVSPENR